MAITTRKVVITSFFVDILDLTVNLIVALITGSVVMLAETIQGAADLFSVTLVLIGLKRSSRPADARRPFGFGKEAYFWTLLATVTTLIITAGLTIYFGLGQIRHPEPIDHIFLAYLALTISVISNGYSFSLSLRRLKSKSSLARLPRQFLHSPLIMTKTTFILDLIGTSAALIGLVALLLYQFTGILAFDGYGAIGIGITLAFFSIILLIGLKDFVVGQSAPPHLQRRIIKVTQKVPGVIDVLDIKTMYLGPEKLLVNLEVHLKPSLTTPEIERVTDEIKHSLTTTLPLIHHVQVEVETPDNKPVYNRQPGPLTNSKSTNTT